MTRMHAEKSYTRLCSLCASALLAFLAAHSGRSAPLDLADAPLFLTLDVKPNLIMAVDDSGSMDFELLLPGNDGSAWWRTANASGSCTAATGNSFTGCTSDGSKDLPAPGKLNFNHAGEANATWKKFSYLFPNGCSSANNSYQRRNCDSTNDHFAIPPLPDFAWARSPEYNTAYFDPTLTYEPWVNGGGYTFGNVNPKAAPFDPVFGGSIDLTRDIAGTGNADLSAACGNATLPGVADNYYFRVYTGMIIPEGACIRVSGRNWEVVRSGGCKVGVSDACLTKEGTTNRTFTLNNNSRVAIRYFPATFYVSKPMPASYGYTGNVLSGKAPDGSELLGYEIKPANFVSEESYKAAIQNFANWFTYYRKRHQALRAGLGKAFESLGDLRVAGFTINQNTVDVTMRDIDVPANRTALYQQFYRDWVRSGGTPNRSAVQNIVRNFRRTGSGAPITHACQKNFGMLFTDGFSNPPSLDGGFSSVGNVDGSYGPPYADGVSNTMADGVMSAYVNRLRTDLPAGKVSVPAACDAPNPDPRLDCNRNLHMSFYAVTLNTRGIQFDPDNPVDPYENPPTWPTSFPARHPSAVDDLWHATINGRGLLLNARTPTEISEKLTAVLRDIVERKGSAASASVNSGSINSETRVFQARFNSGNWSGELLSWGVLRDGTLDDSRHWNAADPGRIPAPGSRRIITVNSNGEGVPFRWNTLDAVRQAELQPSDSLGAMRVDYLRGDTSLEVRNGGQFRNRAGILGDIVNSSPAFVGKPSFLYRDSLEAKPYSAFRERYDTPAERPGIVYVGANDGMLHAFDAETGNEVFAFIPGAVFRNLHELTRPNYSHRYYVDGTPTVGDAFVNGEWRSVLVAGLNKGGQGIYALDITEPGSVSEASASNLVMWEFTDKDDPDLGYTFSRPAIVRMHNGKWAAVFGNGYNSTVDDGHASTTGNAVLYVVDLATGALVRKIDTGVGLSAAYSGGRPNGLATPALVDTNGDHIVDFAYAGDLFGNLWKFDLRGADPASWDVAYKPGGTPAPLFVASRGGIRQPITVRPEVSRGPNGLGMVVLFGTGKYLEPSDEELSANSPVHSFYGVIDRNTGTTNDIVSDRAELTRQTITHEFVQSILQIDGATIRDVGVRVTTANDIGSTRGWYIDLISPANGAEGEMQVTDPVLRNGRIIFTTLIPSPDPCSYGGTSWLMEMDAITGRRLDDSPFDFNGDGLFNSDDFVTLPDGTRVPASGLRPEVGITPRPAVLSGDGSEFKFLPGTTGQMQTIRENPGAGDLGRQSWRQVR